jgi:hypothetical protein
MRTARAATEMLPHYGSQAPKTGGKRPICGRQQNNAPKYNLNVICTLTGSLNLATSLSAGPGVRPEEGSLRCRERPGRPRGLIDATAGFKDNEFLVTELLGFRPSTRPLARTQLSTWPPWTQVRPTPRTTKTDRPRWCHEQNRRSGSTVLALHGEEPGSVVFNTLYRDHS